MVLLTHPSNFVLTKLEEHTSIKELLMQEINKLGTHSLIENFGNVNQQISNTDWHLGPTIKRNYINIFSPIVNIHCENVVNSLKLPFSIIAGSIWFQQYAPTDFHDWHVHANCLYSNVYYLDLPEGSSKTSFKILDEEFEIDVEEGDILTFPGSVMHCSRPNKSKNTKTVISFNTTLKSI